MKLIQILKEIQIHSDKDNFVKDINELRINIPYLIEVDGEWVKARFSEWDHPIEDPEDKWANFFTEEPMGWDDTNNTRSLICIDKDEIESRVRFNYGEKLQEIGIFQPLIAKKVKGSAQKYDILKIDSYGFINRSNTKMCWINSNEWELEPIVKQLRELGIPEVDDSQEQIITVPIKYFKLIEND